ncbi:2-dehydropantoate 2-reductase [Alkalibacillus aidingensis]|uniref:2-dehydropantoate 2-reductase n=1 Tax=Alkalibacillus aidingensis TaxID=2747607 RepID=UPI001660AA87|nr:2-dehydropantoate 2-reductase [Alkalibacillus aidingensis]
MNIAVVGTGAIGMFVAHQLSSMGDDLTCYCRRVDQKDQIEQYGIRLGDHQKRVKVALSSSMDEHDLMIICTKQTNLSPLIDYFHQHHHQTTLLFLQNGMGHIHLIEKLPQKVMVGVCEHGVEKVSDHEVKLNGMGKILFTSLHTNIDSNVVHHLENHDFPFIYEQDLKSTLHKKLIVNSVINPLTMIFELRNGQLLENQDIRWIAYQLTKEACEILEHEVEDMWQTVQNICQNTAQNASSMLIDYRNGRGTEIDYMNGYLIEKAKHPAPTQQLVYRMVKGKERVREVESIWR